MVLHLDTSSHKTVGSYGRGGAARDGGHNGCHENDDARAHCGGGGGITESHISILKHGKKSPLIQGGGILKDLSGLIS